jgi:hypothetical protein
MRLGGMLGFGGQTGGRSAVIAGAQTPLAVVQALGVDSAAFTLGLLAISQGLVAEGQGVTFGLVPAQLDLDVARAAVTLGTTLRLAGTSPVVTLSVTPSSGGSLSYALDAARPKIKVEVTTGGALNVGAFRVSYDSGATWAHSNVTLPAGGTYDLDGLATGLRLTFAAGTYVLNDTYEGTISSISSVEGNAYAFVQATVANQPILRAAAVTPDGKDALFWTGGFQQMLCTTAGAVALLVNDSPLTVFGRIAYNTANQSTIWLSAGRSDDTTNRQRRFGQFQNASGREQHLAINDAAVTTTNSGTTTPLTGGTAAHTVCWYFPGSNGGANLEVNAGAQSLLVATANIGTNTVQRLAISGECASTPSQTQQGYTYRIAMFSSQLGSTDRDLWFAEMA